MRVALERVGRYRKRRSILQDNWSIPDKLAGADLWPLEILKDCYRLSQLGCYGADACKTFGMLCVRSMREVKPCHVEPGRDELPQPILALARGPNGSYNLGTSHTAPTS